MTQNQSRNTRLNVRIFPNLAEGVYYTTTKATTDECAAARECLSHKGFAFKVLQITECSGLKDAFDKTQYSEILETPFYYAGVDKIYTADDIIAELEDALLFLKTAPAPSICDIALISGTLQATKAIAELYKQHNIPPAHAIRVPVRNDLKHQSYEYIWLKDGMKLFDCNAQQIWPKTITAPAFLPQSP